MQSWGPGRVCTSKEGQQNAEGTLSGEGGNAAEVRQILGFELLAVEVATGSLRGGKRGAGASSMCSTFGSTCALAAAAFLTCSISARNSAFSRSRSWMLCLAAPSSFARRCCRLCIRMPRIRIKIRPFALSKATVTVTLHWSIGVAQRSGLTWRASYPVELPRSNEDD